jgi:hypothetical protein
MSYAADDTQAIAQRLKELQAEKDQALTGSSVPAKEEKAEDLPMGYGDYLAWGKFGRLEELYQKATKSAHEWTEQFDTEIELKSLAHPNWPYAGTAHEWRGFVNWEEKLKEKFPEGIKPVETPFMKMIRGR